MGIFFSKKYSHYYFSFEVPEGPATLCAGHSGEDDLIFAAVGKGYWAWNSRFRERVQTIAMAHEESIRDMASAEEVLFTLSAKNILAWSTETWQCFLRLSMCPEQDDFRSICVAQCLPPPARPLPPLFFLPEAPPPTPATELPPSSGPPAGSPLPMPPPPPHLPRSARRGSPPLAPPPRGASPQPPSSGSSGSASPTPFSEPPAAPPAALPAAHLPTADSHGGTRTPEHGEILIVAPMSPSSSPSSGSGTQGSASPPFLPPCLSPLPPFQPYPFPTTCVPRTHPPTLRFEIHIWLCAAGCLRYLHRLHYPSRSPHHPRGRLSHLAPHPEPQPSRAPPLACASSCELSPCSQCHCHNRFRPLPPARRRPVAAVALAVVAVVEEVPRRAATAISHREAR